LISLVIVSRLVGQHAVVVALAERANVSGSGRQP
jgi:hypothetical protein